MTYRSAVLFVIGTAILPVNFLIAQTFMPEAPQARFQSAPKIGDLIPNLTLVNDKGIPTNLRDITNGHYTVITLGCLT